MLLFLQTTISGLINGMIFVLLALGLTLTFGIGRVINFAHGEFYMLGGYAAILAMSYLHAPYLIAIVVAAVVIGLLGILTNRFFIMPVQRKGSSVWAPFLVTLALMTVFQSLALIIFGPNPQLLSSPFANQPFAIGPLRLSQQDIISVVLAILVSAALMLFLKKTRIGIAMRAVASDSETASLMGIENQRIKSLTFALGAGLAAFAGALVLPQSTIDPYVGRMALLNGLTIVIMGGLGNLYGAIIGGVLFGLAEALGAVYISIGYKDAIGYLLMIVILLFRPQGILSKKTRWG